MQIMRPFQSSVAQPEFGIASGDRASHDTFARVFRRVDAPAFQERIMKGAKRRFASHEARG